MKNPWAKKRWWPVAKVVLTTLAGGLAGYLYWAKIGCTSGGCPITSDPWVTTGFGALMGASLAWPSSQDKPEPETADPRAADQDGPP